MAELFNKQQKEQLIKQFKIEREKKNLTQHEVAVKAEMNANYYAKVERGEKNPSSDVLLTIAKVLGLKSSQILPF